MIIEGVLKWSAWEESKRIGTKLTVDVADVHFIGEVMQEHTESSQTDAGSASPEPPPPSDDSQLLH
jgi:hypothetical protein